MWRISAITEDWVDKGCHVHINQIELAVRPDHLGSMVFRKVFSSTSDADEDVATRIAAKLLDDPEFRTKLCDSIIRAMDYLPGIEGRKKSLARGRLREFRFLIIALERLEAS